MQDNLLEIPAEQIDKLSSPSLEYQFVPKINFACQQNSFPLLRDFQITNNSHENSLKTISVTIEASPAFIKPRTWYFDNIGPGRTVLVNDRDVQLDGEFLLRLNDTVSGVINVRVESQGNTLVQDYKDVELLAYNEWGGAGYMPELLAAFITPNDHIIDKILKEASLLLQKAGHGNAIDGYQSGSRQKVWEIASAIYSAIANLKLSYVEPPASFEKDGQKIRLPAQIIEGRLATCLDTALLFGAAFEQAGLNPIIALLPGHALVGLWLQPETFSSIITEEPETLRKRIELNELILIEATFVSSHPSPPFSAAIKAGKDHIAYDKDNAFVAAVDIKKARSHQIKPLGIRTTENIVQSAIVQEFEHLPEAAPLLPNFDIKQEEDTVCETPKGRVERWQRRLLDLTLTNSLLNHKAEKSSLKILSSSPAMLEDRLASGRKISILAKPKPIGTGQDEAVHRARTGQIISEQYMQDAIAKDQVFVDLEDEGLSKRLVDIYRKTQTSLQEGGANTLYLAIGFLLWKREIKDERKFRAPLILVPVTLERKSVRSGIKITAHEDEPRFNTTLIEMLRKDFGITINGLDDLPKDSSGIDVTKIWNKVRLAVKDAPGFEVVEEVVLGHFSFAKYLMWKDLVDRIDQLKENPVVAHLIENPQEPYSNTIDFIDPHELDSLYKPSDLYLPLHADSSQIAAIAAADRGKDFVIYGPPGTGKSQTIANLITHLLGKGKSVLFVSEKIAALEVVYRRLCDIGMGQFCLELHSNKAKKAEVLSQLRNAWEGAAAKTVQQWNEEAIELENLRNKLNKFVSHLHKKYPNGLTPFEAIGIKVKNELMASAVTFNWTNASQHNEQTLKAMRLAVDKLAIQAVAVGDISQSPFALISAGNWSPQWETDIVSRAAKLSKSTVKFLTSFNNLCKLINVDLPGSLDKFDSLARLADLLKQSYKKQGAYALEMDGAERINSLEEAVIRLKNYASAQAKLSCAYEPEAWRKLDGNEIMLQWQQANQSWLLKRFFAKRRIIKEMRANGALGVPDPSNDAPILAIIREEGTAIDTLDKKLSDLQVWRKHLTDLASIEAMEKLIKQINGVVSKLSQDIKSLEQIKQAVRYLIKEGNELLATDATAGIACDNYLLSWQEFQDSSSSFEELADFKIRDSYLRSENVLDDIQVVTENIVSRHNELRDWCAWRRARTEALNQDLKSLVDALEDGLLSMDNSLLEVFETAYCDWWSKAIITEDEVLRSFSTPEHVSTINKFRELDDQFQKTTINYIITKLRAELPSQQNINRGVEWGILQRELQKQRQHKPIRQLMQEIPDVVTRLTPCLMMSPLSIAQYLPTGQELFDVVIFDEASQITVWDAVGAVSRGKQVIVAGDPKQMPPSNRFGRSEEESDGVEYEKDLESILDEMLGANIPYYKLNWHYRSRKENLIAFSNYRYYDGTLITFPAPVFDDSGVKLVKVNGIYSRSIGRQNEIEAKLVVQECVRRLKHPDKSVREQSIGIVTFNTEQQSLIENLLDSERAKDPSIERAFSKEEVLEPVFVKNLDTVQGDERDVILFSITFGPDIHGRITMNFGDLNKQGGGRRLNVALTRARSEMLIFSSLPYEQIDLSRTQSSAVTDLKHFLEYAEKGPSIFGSLNFGPQGDFESPFEIAVASSLRDKGWQVHPQIGASAYRIDLGILHPNQPGRYLAGVECDGATYHSSATARDRDKIRQAVLEGLGWTLIRIWSTDWWTNKSKALKELEERLSKLLEAN